MINPEMINKVDSYYTDGGNTILDIKSLPYFDDDIYDLCDEKSYKKYMILSLFVKVYSTDFGLKSC